MTQTTEQEKHPIRGGDFTGTVISNKMQKSATVRWEHSQSIPKYERKERRNTKITAHVPEDLELEEGDTVEVSETRPISKTKSHIITKVNPNQSEEE